MGLQRGVAGEKLIAAIAGQDYFDGSPSELGQAVTNLQAIGGAGVVLDVKTGEVMALASFPTFNPNNPGAAPEPPKGPDGKPLYPGAFYNRVTDASYELGSAFKPITMAAAIDSGTVTSMGRRFDATAPIPTQSCLVSFSWVSELITT